MWTAFFVGGALAIMGFMSAWVVGFSNGPAWAELLSLILAAVGVVIFLFSPFVAHQSSSKIAAVNPTGYRRPKRTKAEEFTLEDVRNGESAYTLPWMIYKSYGTYYIRKRAPVSLTRGGTADTLIEVVDGKIFVTLPHGAEIPTDQSGWVKGSDFLAVTVKNIANA